MGSRGNIKATLLSSRRVLGVVGAFSFFVNLLMLVVPLYSMEAFNRVLPSRSEDTLWMMTLIAVFALLIFAFLEDARARILVHLSGWIDRALAPAILAASVRASSLKQSGIDTQGLNDLNALRSFLTGAGIFSFFDAPWVPLYLLVVFMFDPLQGFIALVGALVLFGLALWNEVATRGAMARSSAKIIAQNRAAQATIRNADVVEAMGMLPALLARWSREQDIAISQQARASRIAGTIGALSRFMRFFVQIAILAAGVYLAIWHDLTAGAMIAASIVIGRALAPVEQMIGGWKQFSSARAAYHRLARLMDEVPDPRTTTQYPPAEGRLTAEGVTMFLPGSSAPVLQQVSFGLTPGEAMAVVGPSGAGKSTLARLLVGLWNPSAGKVRLDNADVFMWERGNFGRNVGYLPQDIELFAGTVKENIARMTSAEDTEVIAAAKAANAHDLILRLPHGYDTVIGDGGVGLSGGQRQRIALARALFGTPALLVLDEPNANLDMEGEQALLNALAEAKTRGSTIVVITHRTGLLQIMDKILMLRDGRVAAFGGRDQVLARIAPNLVMASPAAPAVGMQPAAVAP